jgi:N-acetylmuramoyl-L-alanine amidase
MNQIKRIIIHCSDSRYGDRDFIKRIHVDQNGWKDIGYNAIILNGRPKKDYYMALDGLLVEGRTDSITFKSTLLKTGAHAKGHNTDIGVCLIGKNSFTDKQFETLYYFCKLWKQIIPDIEIIGHNKVNDHKTCPNFDVDLFNEYLNNSAVSSKINWSKL